MKRQIIIGCLLLILTLACSLSNNLLIIGGPNPAAQKSTLENIQQAQASQNAMIQTQVALGLAAMALTQTSASNTVINEAANMPSSASSDEVSAQKTAEMEKLLTNVPQSAVSTPTSLESEAVSQAENPSAASSSAVDPKGSDGTDFTGAEFKAFGQLNETTYGISIDLKGPLGSSAGKNYIIKVGDNLLDKCSAPLQYPNRLYCTGKPFQGGKYNVLVVENVNGSEIVRFSYNYTFPRWTPTPPPPTKKPKKDEENE